MSSSAVDRHSPEQKFLLELERIEPRYELGRRQDLVCGISAYAAVALGLEQLTVERAIMTLAHEKGDKQIQDRLVGVRHTFRKVRAGKGVSWTYFYEKAGMTSPVDSRDRAYNPSREAALAMLQPLLEEPKLWVGMAYKRLVLEALVKQGALTGVVTPSGLEVSISHRQLCEKANCSRSTVQKVLAKLQELGMLEKRRSTTGDQLTTSGTIILSLGVHTLCEIPTPLTKHQIEDSSPAREELRKGLDEWDVSSTHPAFRKGCLGPAGYDFILALQRANTPLTLSEIARAAGRIHANRWGNVHKRLLNSKIVLCENTRYSLRSDWALELDLVAVNCGATEAARRRQDQHKRDREKLEAFLVSRALRKAAWREDDAVLPETRLADRQSEVAADATVVYIHSTMHCADSSSPENADR
jgi:hypothetical protein